MEDSGVTFDDTTGLSGLKSPGKCRGDELAVIWILPTGLSLTPLRGKRVSIGRSAESDARLLASGVSRHHAEFRADGPLWLVCDGGSTNGTFVGRQRVAQALLTSGAVIRMGEAVGVVVSGAGARLAPAFGKLADGLYGGSAFLERLADARRVALSNLCVVLQGETGSGKEQAALALHTWSGRGGPLIAVNCAALPDGLVESELFGYRRGAFTGAEQNHAGYLRSAQGGTLFLDEVTELSPSSQAKLLRALETREVVPLGETRPVPIDVRVISATQQPLERRVADGGFRADLMARLGEFCLELPPLRERREDVPGLFLRFLDEACGGSAPPLEAKALEALCAHDWPLNVRELRNVARRTGVLHSHHPLLRLEHLPPELAAPPPAAAIDESRPGPGGSLGRDTEELERLVGALVRSGGRLGRAATDVGISRQRAQRLLQRFPERDPRRQG